VDTRAIGSISLRTIVLALIVCAPALGAAHTSTPSEQPPPATPGPRIFLKSLVKGATEVSGLLDPPDVVVRRVTIEVRQKAADSTCQDTEPLIDRVVATTVDADRGLFKVTLSAALKADVCVIALARTETTTPTMVRGFTIVKAPPPPETPAPPAVVGPVRAGMRAISGDVKVTAEQKAKITRIKATVWRSRDERATPTAMAAAPAVPPGAPAERTPESPRYVMTAATSELDASGAFNLVMPQAVMAGQYVEIEVFAGDDLFTHGWTIVEDPGDWGRIRAYFAGGVILSHDREEFSAQDFVLALILDNAWYQPTPPALIDQETDLACKAEAKKALTSNQLGSAPKDVNEYRRQLLKTDRCWKSRWKLRWQVNSFLDVRMTALPVQATEAAGTATAAASDASTTATKAMATKAAAAPGSITAAAEAATEDTFLVSRKAALIHFGIYTPFYGRMTMWRYQGHPNALFVAPVLRMGVQTINRGDEALNFSGEEDDNVYYFWSGGLGIGHYKLSDSKDRAPELISYLHITRGKFENFRRLDDSPSFKPLRWAVEGRLKIPETPMQVGLDANFGRGPDSVSFVFATRFDIGELFGKLKVFQP
jgi:hypothetical protein